LATVARVLRSGASRHRSAEAEPMKRADALRQGLPEYRTGKVCKNGHAGVRRTSTGQCIRCEQMRQGPCRTTADEQKAHNAALAAKRREQYGPPLRCFLVGLAATMEGSEAKARSDYLNRKIREAAGMD
jgi:hypothetical protein